MDEPPPEIERDMPIVSELSARVNRVGDRRATRGDSVGSMSGLLCTLVCTLVCGWSRWSENGVLDTVKAEGDVAQPVRARDS